MADPHDLLGRAWVTNAVGCLTWLEHPLMPRSARPRRSAWLPDMGSSLPFEQSGSTAGSKWGANIRIERSWTALNDSERSRLTCRICISAGRRNRSSLVHTEEVAGSIPASPTPCFACSDGLSMIFIGGPSMIFGSKLGARSPGHIPQSEEFRPFPCFGRVLAADPADVLLPGDRHGQITRSQPCE